MNEKVKKHYDLLIDEGVELLNDPPILKEYMKKWDGEDFIELLNIDKSKIVLEVGVGTGRIANKVIKKCKYFTGIDFSSKTIDRAKQNLIDYRNTEFICDDVMDYNFNKKFDVIYSTLVFMHIKEKKKLINNLLSLLSMNGYIVISFSKDQSEELIYNNRKVRLYPNNIKELYSYINEISRIIDFVDVENAVLIKFGNKE